MANSRRLGDKNRDITSQVRGTHLTGPKATSNPLCNLTRSLVTEINRLATADENLFAFNWGCFVGKHAVLQIPLLIPAIDFADDHIVGRRRSWDRNGMLG